MKKGIKIAILALSFILVIGVTAVSVWALTKTNISSKFKVHFIGSRDVVATIDASSHHLGYDDFERDNIEEQPAVEVLETLYFDKYTTLASQTLSFEKEINVIRKSDKVFYRFKITNNSTKMVSSDVIIKPIVLIEDEDTALISSLYYTFENDNSTWQAFEDGFITLHKNQTVYFDLQFVIGKSFEEDLSLSGNIVMELYSELDLPADYVQEYEYLSYDESKSTLTRRKVCYQCDHEYNEIETCKFGDNDFLIVTPENVQSLKDSFNNYKTVVFTPGDYSDITIDVTPSNVTKIYDMENISENIPVWTNANGSFIDNPYNFESGKTYLYETELNDVSFVAMDGANFKQFTINSLAYYNYDGDNIRGTDYSYNSFLTMTYAKRILINGLTFDKFNFQGFSNNSVAGISIGGSSRFNVDMEDIVIKNCTFDSGLANTPNPNEELLNQYTAINIGHYTADDNISITNLKIINNYFKNQNQAMYIQRANNILIANNVFEGVAVRCVDTYNAQGNVVLKNNKIFAPDVLKVYFNINGKTMYVIIDNCKLNGENVYSDALRLTLNIYSSNSLILEITCKPTNIFTSIKHFGKFFLQSGRG